MNNPTNHDAPLRGYKGLPSEKEDSSSIDGGAERNKALPLKEEEVLRILEDRVGLGTSPVIRQLFFRKIYSAYDRDFKRVGPLLNRLLRGMRLAENPPHWFCRVLKNELQAMGLWDEEIVPGPF